MSLTTCGRSSARGTGTISYKAYFTYLNYDLPHPVHDIHHQLDRTTAEGPPADDQNARGDAQRGIGYPAHGQDKTAMDKTSYRREAGVQNRPRQGTVLRQMNLPLRAARRGDEQ